MMSLLPAASSAIIFVFTALVLRRYAARRGRHLLLWGIGLGCFGVASAAEAYSALAWHPLVFRLWYLGGAVLSAAWIGQGTVYLLASARLPQFLISLVFGYAAATMVFLTLGRFGLGTKIVWALISFHGLIFASTFNRLLVRRWRPEPIAAVLTIVLAAASAAAAAAVFTVPLDPSAFDPTQPLGVQYRAILPPGALVRRLTPAFNIYGTIALAGGALYSAWLLRRGAIAPQRVLGNVLIALGAFAIASAGTMVRFGLGGYLALGELIAAALMFGGFLLTTSRPVGERSTVQRAQA